VDRFSVFKEDIQQARFVLFHPFKGFWDLKHERQSNYRNVIIILTGLVLTYAARSQFTGFVLDMSDPTEFNFFYQTTSIVIPFFIWCSANWGITTLVDGEGTFKDITITTAYALIPIVIINVPLVIISNIVTIQEAVFFTILESISLIWAAFLLFSGILTIHQFSVKKTLATIAIAFTGMVIMVSIALLFVTLLQNIINFIRLLWIEFGIRYYS